MNIKNGDFFYCKKNGADEFYYISEYDKEKDAAKVTAFFVNDTDLLNLDTDYAVRRMVVTKISNREGFTRIDDKAILIKALQTVIGKIQISIEKREIEKREVLAMIDIVNPLFNYF